MSGIDKNTILLLKGEDFTDSSLFKYKITNNDASLSSDGKFGKCFNFNGGHFKLEPIDIGTFKNGVTVDFWCYRERVETSVNRWIVSGSYGDFAIGFEYDRNGGKFSFNAFGNTPMFNYIMPVGRFLHIAIVCVNNKAYLYEDGTLIDTIDYVMTKTTTNTLTFGHFSVSNAPLCRVDEFRISNIARWTENFTPPATPYTHEVIDKIPAETNLVESVNSMDKVYENIDFQRFLLGNKLKRIGVDTLPSDKMSSLIDKIGKIAKSPLPKWVTDNKHEMLSVIPVNNSDRFQYRVLHGDRIYCVYDKTNVYAFAEYDISTNSYKKRNDVKVSALNQHEVALLGSDFYFNLNTSGDMWKRNLITDTDSVITVPFKPSRGITLNKIDNFILVKLNDSYSGWLWNPSSNTYTVASNVTKTQSHQTYIVEVDGYSYCVYKTSPSSQIIYIDKYNRITDTAERLISYDMGGYVSEPLRVFPGNECIYIGFYGSNLLYNSKFDIKNNKFTYKAVSFKPSGSNVYTYITDRKNNVVMYTNLDDNVHTISTINV